LYLIFRTFVFVKMFIIRLNFKKLNELFSIRIQSDPILLSALTLKMPHFEQSKNNLMIYTTNFF
jgi:hypothetical protein